MSVDILIVDYETSGYSPRYGAEPVQLGAIRLDGDSLNEKASFVSCIRLETPHLAHPKALAVSGLTLHALASAPDSISVFHAFEAAMFSDEERASIKQHVRFCAHNKNFDMLFHRLFLSRAGFGMDRHGDEWMCTREMARNRWGPTQALSDIAALLGIERAGKHDALEDVRIAAQIIRHIRNKC